MKLIADKQLRGIHGNVEVGDEFEAEAERAVQLIAAKAAHPAPKAVERATVDEGGVEKAADVPEPQRKMPTKPVNPAPEPKPEPKPKAKPKPKPKAKKKAAPRP